ncbi:hypothetical protein HDU82_003235, partial [Entophlyctis luteolus]
MINASAETHGAADAQTEGSIMTAAEYKNQVQELIDAGKHLLDGPRLLAPEPTVLPPVAESEEPLNELEHDHYFVPPFRGGYFVAEASTGVVDAATATAVPHAAVVSTPVRKKQRVVASHTPRPVSMSNSFMIYRREKQAQILAQYKGEKALHNNAISKVVADMWREESAQVRQEYAAKAEQEKIQHMLKYPGYKYTPRRNAAGAQRKKATGSEKSDHMQLHLLPFPHASETLS